MRDQKYSEHHAARMVGNVLIAMVFLFSVGLGLELVARIVEGRGAVGRDQPPPKVVTFGEVDKLVKSMVAAFDNKYTYDQVIAMFPFVQEKLKYKPWIQIGNADHSNPFSVVEKGIRKTLRSHSCGEASAQGEGGRPRTVWFYGGSTTYGIGVPWWDTIPSKFVEEADRNSVCVVAINFGVPYHYSRQEAIYFSLNLMKEQTPEVVVFLDGLNDLALPGATIRSEPFFTPTLDKLIPAGPDLSMDTILNRNSSDAGSRLFSFFRDLRVLRWLGLSPGRSEREGEEAYSNKEPPVSESLSTDEQVVDAIVDRYVATRNLIAKLCEGFSIKCFQFLQPVPAVDYKPQENDVLTKDTRSGTARGTKLEVGYKFMKEVFRSNQQNCPMREKGIDYMDISSLLEAYEGIPYVDYTHYAPRANKLIAAKIFHCVFPRP